MPPERPQPVGVCVAGRERPAGAFPAGRAPGHRPRSRDRDRGRGRGLPEPAGGRQAHAGCPPWPGLAWPDPAGRAEARRGGHYLTRPGPSLGASPSPPSRGAPGRARRRRGFGSLGLQRPVGPRALGCSQPPLSPPGLTVATGSSPAPATLVTGNGWPAPSPFPTAFFPASSCSLPAPRRCSRLLSVKNSLQNAPGEPQPA